MSLRTERMADEIRDILAANFQGGRMNDPRLEFVTITAVKISPDLQVATVGRTSHTVTFTIRQQRPGAGPEGP